jgi:predicted SAM-dependent methyltransferase
MEPATSRRIRRAFRAVLPPLLTRRLAQMHRELLSKRAARSLKTHRKLHLACGDRLLDGWANLDEEPVRPGVIPLDLRLPLPMAAESVDFIFSEHFIEHLSKGAAEALLRESRRVLAGDGVIRLSTPDLRYIARKYLDGDVAEWHDEDALWFPPTPCDMVNEMMHNWGHQYIYDRDTLLQLLTDCGFRNVQDVRWRESEHPELRNLETRQYRHELIVEATA